MAKRISVAERRATDARGVEVIFGGAPITETPSASSSPLPQNDEQVSEALSLQKESPTDTSTKPTLAKVTIYIRPEQVFAIESIQLAQRQLTGQKPDKSQLVQEAVDLLIAKYAS